MQWYAICLSDIGDYEGIKVKIGNSYIIRDHLEVKGYFDLQFIYRNKTQWICLLLSRLFLQKAIELNPRDATSFYILGFW